MAQPSQTTARKSALIESLSEIPLFQKCEYSHLERLARFMREMTFGPREYLMRQGDTGTKFYLIMSGLADVIIDGESVGKLQSGDYCGELALVQNIQRTASVQVINHVRAFWIDKATFKRVLQNDMEIVFYQRLKLKPERFDEIERENEFDSPPESREASPSESTEAVQSPSKRKSWKTKRSSREITEKPGSKRNALNKFSGLSIQSSSLSSKKMSTGTATNRSIPKNSARKRAKEIRPSQAEVRWLLSAVQTNVLFRQLTSNERRYVIAQMHRVDVKRGDVLIKEGDSGNAFYVVRSGRFKVSQKGKGLVRYVTTKDCIGELSLIYDAPRSCTVTAISNAVIWKITRSTLRYHVKELSETKNDEKLRFLKKVDLFSSLLSFEFAAIAGCLEEESFEEGQVIISEGESITGKLNEHKAKFYLIKSGMANVYANEDQIGMDQPIRSLIRGNWFGERALLTSEKRSATVIAMQSCEVYTLKKSQFELLLGPLGDIMNRHMKETYTGRDSKKSSDSMCVNGHSMKHGSGGRFSSKMNGSAIGKGGQDSNLNIPTVKSTLTDLVNLGRIGVGGYGIVSMVRDPQYDSKNERNGSRHSSNGKNTGVYALKSVRKDLVVHNKQTRQIQNELAVCKSIRGNPFVINLIRTYQDNLRVYFLMDIAMGGDLFHHMRSAPHFPMNQVRFYAASVIDGFEWIHSNGIVYRDLKPENLVLMSNGYIKITDFGLAKPLKDGEKTFTVCGTPDYLAPEIILGRGHDFAVDWWALGILIYEMVAKVPPFMGNPATIADKILASKPKFTYLFGMNVIDLINRLLTKNPNERLGVIGGGKKTLGSSNLSNKDGYSSAKVQKIRDHAWFKDFDWISLRNGTMKAPYVPSIKAIDDKSNFKMSLQPDPSQPKPVKGDLEWCKGF